MHALIKISTVVLLILVLVITYRSNYSRHSVEIISEEAALYGSLVMPKNQVNKPVPVLIFVHGDGATSSGSYGYYAPLWEALAEAGISSLSWDKQGVGGSSGHWLGQSMKQRADELSAAIDWISKQPQLDSEHIGVIGFSQAGWVIPEVLAQDTRLKYAIMVSTAVNWEQQGQFQTVKRLQSQGQKGELLAQNMAVNQQLDELIKQREPYNAYQQFMKQTAPESYGGKVMSEARYEFVTTNMSVDAMHSLRKIEQPVLALFGDSDEVVDVQHSIESYRRSLAGPFQYKVYSNADHGLFRTKYFADIQKDSIWFGIKMNALGARGLTDQFIVDVLDWVNLHSSAQRQGATYHGQ